MGLNLAQMLQNYEGIHPKPMTLADTARWYRIQVVSDRVELVFVMNKDDSNELRVTLLPKDLDPNSIGNFNTTWGFFNIPEEDHGAFSIKLNIWVQPTTANQAIYVAQFSEKPLGDE